MKQQVNPTHNEKGFVLALAIFTLAICTMIGIAAMMTSTTEVDIAANEVIYRQTFYQGEAGAVAAAQAIIQDQGQGQGQSEWDDNTPFSSDNSVMIIDGNFLWEGKDADNASSVWNSWKRYADAPSGSKDNFKPIDDLMVRGSNPTTPFETDTRPDITIRSENRLFNVDIDVDKVASRHLAGSGAEFGTGAEGTGTSAYKIIYNIDCIGALPGRTLRNTDGTLNQQTPQTEIVLGYRLVPQ
jgi:hypothetical protein